MIILHTSGKGCSQSGNWCFSNGFISIKDILKSIPQPPKFVELDVNINTEQSDANELAALMNDSSFAIYIFCDCSWSGRWLKIIKKQKMDIDILLYAACDGYKERKAQDMKNGGKFTSFLLTGNKMLGMPEPVAVEVNQGIIFDSSQILWSNMIVNQLKMNVYRNVNTGGKVLDI